MPEHRRHRRAVVVLAGAVLALVASAAPAVLAQTTGDTEGWERSRFTTPFQGGSATVDDVAVEIAGVFEKEPAVPVDEIVGVDVRFEHADGSPAVPGDSCVPAPQPQVEGEAGTDDAAGTITRTFRVPADASVWPCNGRFRVIASARSREAAAPFELIGELAVAVPPPDVSSTAARWDGGAGAVVVSWEPFTEDEAPEGLVGYRVERAPGGGAFTSVGPDLGAEASPSVRDADPDGATYRYRVRAIRSGPDGPVLSRGGAEVEVTVPGAPGDTTTTTRPRSDRPRGGANRGGTGGVAAGRVTPRLPGPPTTADTGFDETLDYGDRDAPAVDDDELAGQEGQAIIRTEDEGAGLLAPAAGALVLLGWAGHVAYLNRLAKQF